MSAVRKFLTIVWMHVLRMWRLKTGYVNTVVNTSIWLFIFALSVFAFTPAERVPEVAPYVFWGMLMWALMSYNVWFIAGWTWWFIGLGMVEEHLLTNTSPIPVLLARGVVGVSLAALTVLILSPIFYFIGGPAVYSVTHPAYLALGLLTLYTMAASYALTLAAISFRIGVPGVILDITNFLAFFVGILTPPTYLPSGLRAVSLAIPYTHAAELVRYGAAGAEPLIGIGTEAVAAVAIAAGMAGIAVVAQRLSLKAIRKYGVRGVGRM